MRRENRVQVRLGITAPWMIGAMLLPGMLTAQPGWKTIKDKTGACQISVPSSWTEQSIPGHVASPVSTGGMVITGTSPFKPFRSDTLKILGVEKVYENSAARSFYVTKPNGTPPQINYHIEAPGAGNRCIAEISLPSNYSEDEAKKIGMSLAAVR